MWRHLDPEEIEMIKKENLIMYAVIEKLVNEWDPVGFIKGGAPDDEYDCITVHLINLLKDERTSEDIYEFIVHELDHHFGMGISSVKPEFMEKFIHKHKSFSEGLTEWYKIYCREISEKG